MSIRTDDTLGRVYRFHRWWGTSTVGCAVDQIAAFYAACEASGVPATGAELIAWHRSRGAAMAAWRRVSRSERQRCMARWAMAATCFLRGLNRRAVA